MNYLSSLLVLASVVIPCGIAIAIFWLNRKWRDRDGRRSPIENRRIFGPGEQLRKRIETHTDEMMFGLTMLFFLGPCFIALWALQHLDWQRVRFGFWDFVLLAIFILMTGATVYRIFINSKHRLMAKAGLKAEMYTAQELNRLMALGCTVMHDVPGDNFNIDHVVIGPRAIYAVETKSVRKPPATDAKAHFKVAYDGNLLRFPDFSDKKRLQQTKRQADWLAKYLREAVGKAIPVVPALSLPGWWIEVTPQALNGDVRVFNPSGRGANFMADRKEIGIDAATCSLVTQALVMRYPSEASPKST
jgi:hypothetical protein